MLGAAQAGTTIGLNFQSWYYDSGTIPQTIGFGQGYQTTGFPVTAKAFGVATANWVNTDPLDCQSVLDTSVNLGAITAHLTAVNPWSGDIGNLVDPLNEWTPGFQSTVLPGNDEVTWGYEDNTGWTNTLSGLNTTFPNGYVIGLIGAVKCTVNSRVVVTAGATTTTNAFETIYTAGNANFSGPVGLMGIPGNTDSITFGGVSRDISSAQSCGLAGFILTDQPVITKSPVNTTVNQGAALNLTANVIGVGAVTYQWQHAGTNFPGATTVPYSKTAAPEDAGSWVLVATNPYGNTTSDAATVTINQVPLITTDLSPATNSVYAGTPITLSIVAGGANPLVYQWYRNGTALTGATNASLIASNLTAGNFGYNVTVSNQFSPPVARSQTNYQSVIATPDAYTAVVAAGSPNSYWPFGETAGITAVDYSGLGHNAGISNGMTLGATGPQSPAFPGFNAATKAYLFDGASAYVDAGTAASLDGPTDFTVEAWINTVSPTVQIIAQQRDSAGFNGQYKFGVNSDGTLNFLVYNNGFQASLNTAVSVIDGAWHYVAAVRSGTNEYIYVDGSVAASGSGPVANLVGTLRTYIGSDQRDHAAYFNGSMAAVGIYSQALTQSQITRRYVTATGAPFVLSLAPGGMVEDSKPVGTAHPGAGHNNGWSNSVTDVAAVPVTRTGVAVFTTATGSQITTPADPDFDSPNGTIMFWMLANAPIPGPGLEAAILFDRRTTNGAVITLRDDGSVGWQGPGGSRNEFSGGYLPDGNWHHVAVTYGQTTADTLSIYVDGVLAASTAVTNGWTWPPTQQLEIGKSHDNYWKRFDGLMDDFRIYNRVLTSTEVSAVYTSGGLVDTSALKVRYDFGTAAGVGQTVKWSFGTLMSSPTLGPSAVWTPVPGATPPGYAFLPTGTALFFRAQY